MKSVLVISFLSLILAIGKISHATYTTGYGSYGGYGGFQTIKSHKQPKNKFDDRFFFYDGLYLPGTPFPLVGGQYSGAYALNPVPGIPLPIPVPAVADKGKDKGGQPAYTGPAPEQMPPVQGQNPAQGQFPPAMGQQNQYAPSLQQFMPQMQQQGAYTAADPFAAAAPPARIAEPESQIPQAPQAPPMDQSQIPQAPATPQMPPQQQQYQPAEKDKGKAAVPVVPLGPVPVPPLIDVPPPLLGIPKRAGAFDRGVGARYGLGSLHNPVLVGNQYEYGPLAGAEIFGIDPHYSPYAGFGYGALGYRGSPGYDFVRSATDIYAYPDVMESLPVLEQQPLVQSTAWANGQIVGELYPQYGRLAYPAFSVGADAAVPIPVPY